MNNEIKPFVVTCEEDGQRLGICPLQRSHNQNLQAQILGQHLLNVPLGGAKNRCV